MKIKKAALIFAAALLLVAVGIGIGTLLLSPSGSTGYVQGNSAPEIGTGNSYADLRYGDIITFGSYEQDNNLRNGPEPIEWQVLAVEDGAALVISRYGLDMKPYNDTLDSVAWETCTLRSWLNGKFFNSAFSSGEQSRILQMTISNAGNPKHSGIGGSDTTDRIFLLSIEEAKQYFRSDASRQCTATAYAVGNGANEEKAVWWLRTPGITNKFAVLVGKNGTISLAGGGVSHQGDVVRPALWLNLER